MSIQSEVARLQTAKNELASAIADKGVSVPAGAKIDDFPALVASIAQGGGEIAEIQSGSLSANVIEPTSSVTFSSPVTYVVANTASEIHLIKRGQSVAFDSYTKTGALSSDGTRFTFSVNNMSGIMYYCALA